MRILIADDDDVSRLKVEYLLTQWGYEVVAVKNGNEALGVLQGPAPPALAILDWMMPAVDGIELCRRIRRERATSYVYVILLTSRLGKESMIAGMEAGADEYLTKPYDPEELRLRVRAGQRIIELQEALRVQATHDALTGAWNRGAIIEMLQRDLFRAQREGFPVGVIMVDLDHFKKINDAHGHQVGDAVLRETVQRMTSLLRPYDALGRYGGEEFLVVLLDCPATDALHLAERLRKHIAGTPVETAQGKVSVTASLGMATTQGEDRLDATELIRLADQALYAAKQQGRNRVAMAPHEEVSQLGGPR